MRRRFPIALLLMWCSVRLIPAHAAEAPLSIEARITARAAVLVDLATGATLWGQCPDDPLPCASLSKAAVALFIAERYPERLAEEVTITREMLEGGTRAQRVMRPWLLGNGIYCIGLKEGEHLSASHLIEALLVASAGDAANALAFHFGSGDPRAFMSELNLYLRSLGCTQTHLETPSGMDHPNHYSSARDLARMGRAMFVHPWLSKVLALKYCCLPRGTAKESRRVPTSNRFLKEGPLRWERCIGGKTGYTGRARMCLLAAGGHPQRSVLAVVLGAESPQHYREVRLLCEAALAEQAVEQTWYRSGDPITSLHLRGARTPIPCTVGSDLAAWRYQSSAGPVRLEVRWRTGLRPPLPAHAVIGEAYLVDSESQRCITSAPVLTAVEVEATWCYWLSHLWKRSVVGGDRLLLASLILSCLSWAWALSRPRQVVCQTGPLFQ